MLFQKTPCLLLARVQHIKTFEFSFCSLLFFSIVSFIFNAAQPGVGRVQVLGSKKFQTDEQLFSIDIKRDIRGLWGS